jgi:hypothetical protein
VSQLRGDCGDPWDLGHNGRVTYDPGTGRAP